MNRRYLSWVGLTIANGAITGISGPYTTKSDAAKAVREDLGEMPREDASGGVFPIEFEEVSAAPAPDPAPVPVATPATGAATDPASSAPASDSEQPPAPDPAPSGE